MPQGLRASKVMIPAHVIYVDSRVVTDTPFFSRAFMLCFALFYVLNLEYCKQAREVCLFIQEFVFSLPVPSVGTRQSQQHIYL